MAKSVLPRRVPSREEKYMGLAFMYASFSKDPNSQIGAVIVTSDNELLGLGYNGPPAKYNDQELDWSRPNKYNHIIHSEINAIKHSNRDKLKGSTIFVTAKPCASCMLDIVDAGIIKVMYFPFKICDSSSMLNNKQIFEAADDIAKKGRLTVQEFKGNLNWIRDRIKQMDQLGIFD